MKRQGPLFCSGPGQKNFRAVEQALIPDLTLGTQAYITFVAIAVEPDTTRNPSGRHSPDRLLGADLASEIPHAVPALSCPDLQDLITRFGGYNKIPAEAWKQFDRNIAAYRRQLRALTVTGVSKPTASNPYKLYPASEECCLCYQRGAFGYRKQTLARFGRRDLLSESTSADDLIWFCHQHKPANDFADARRGTP